MVEGLFSVWQFFEPTLAKLLFLGQPFNPVHGQILKNNIAIWSHCIQTVNPIYTCFTIPDSRATHATKAEFFLPKNSQ